MNGENMCDTAMGLAAFLRAVALVPKVEPALAARHRLLDEGSAVLGGIYAVGEQLGRGLLSTAYRAHDLELDRPVAVKVFRLETLTAILRGELARLLERAAPAAGG